MIACKFHPDTPAKFRLPGRLIGGDVYCSYCAVALLACPHREAIDVELVEQRETAA